MEHHTLEGEHIHVPYAWSYADETEREAAAGFVAADIGKLALQEDTNSLYILTAITPTWLSVGGNSIHLDVAGEFDVLDEKAATVGGDKVLIEDSEDGGAKKWVDADNFGGGGGGSYILDNYLPDVPPSSPGTYDDEFDDDSLDAAWTGSSWDTSFDMLQTSGAKHVSETALHGYMLMQGVWTNSGAYDFYKAFTPSSSQAFTVVAKVSFGAYLGATERNVVLGIRGNADNVFYELRIGTNNSNNLFRTVYANGGAAAQGASALTAGFAGQIYLMIVHDGSKNFSAFVSHDGIGWSCIELNRNLSSLSSFTRLAIFPSGGTVDGIVGVDFVRYFTTAGQYKIGLDV
jgi:hypothetical protein